MAEKRMFAKSITESDDFLSMSKDAQCLYYHLCMYADDDGFINNTKSILRIVGSDIKYLEELKQNKYIHEFDSGITLIMHWKRRLRYPVRQLLLHLRSPLHRAHHRRFPPSTHQPVPQR